MTFIAKQQKEHRDAFIKDCHQKAWGAACNAEWIGKQLDELMAQYEKLGKEDRDLDEQIKTLDNAVDYHTKENREKRKALQQRRNALAKSMEAIGQSAGQLQKGIQQLYANVEQNLALAAHAESWEWKEIQSSLDKNGVSELSDGAGEQK
jgi:chromosome segregation ATPase